MRSFASLRMTAARWPLPALLAWAACWAVFVALRGVGGTPSVVLAIGFGVAFALAIGRATPWRRLIVGAGFPLSLAASGLAPGLPAWAWLGPLVLLALVYPLGAWRDAPVFPTPRNALSGLAAQLDLPAIPRILDAGCGAGDALLELQREFPAADLSGFESSRLLALLTRWRCPFARIRRTDMWTADWTGFDLVYLFQRPESMDRAAAKAAHELRPGAWLASLEFEVESCRPTWMRLAPDGRPVWLYRVPFKGVH